MDMKRLLEKMDQFAGQAVGQKPGDQVRGTEKATKKKSGEHPFKGRLVGASESVLKDLDKQIAEGEQERSLLEDYERFSRDWCGICGQSPCNCTTISESEKKGLYYYVNRRKKAGTSRPKNHPKAPSAQDWKNAAKTAKKESVAEDAEPMDREWALVKKLGRLGERIVQNPKLWSKYTEAIDTENLNWIISLIQEGTGADKSEVMRLSKLFGDIGGGTGRIVDFAWAVKEGHWHEDFLNPYRQHRAQGVAEGMLDNPGQADNPVAQAIIRRILMQRTDLLAKHGPEKVGQAVDEVADFVGDVDEIGSSDVSGWIRHVEQMLGNMEEGVAEAFIAPALSAANAAAEFRRQGQAGGGYRGRIDMPVTSQEEYLEVGRALKRAAKLKGQHIEYGLSDGTMSVFSDTMDSDTLDEFIDMVLSDLQEGIEANLNTKYSLKNLVGDVKSLDNLSLEQLNKIMGGHVKLVGRKFRSQEGNSFTYDVKLDNGNWYIMHIVYVHGLLDGWLTDEENNKIPLSKVKPRGMAEDKPLAPMPKSLIGGPRFSGGQRQVTPMPKSLTGGPRFSGGGGYTGKGVAEGNRGLSKRQETEFHAKLDKLVHDTFGKRKGEMAEEAVPPSVPTAGGPAGAGQQKQQNPEQAALLKKQQASMQQNLANLKTAGVDIDPAKAAQSLQKTDTGAPMNAMDKDTIAKLAPALGNVMSNPSTASQLNTLIKKAGGGA